MTKFTSLASVFQPVEYKGGKGPADEDLGEQVTEGRLKEFEGCEKNDKRSDIRSPASHMGVA